MWMLDTNICSYVLRRRPPSIKSRFDRAAAGQLCISTVTLAELFYGTARHPKGAEIRREIDDFVSRLEVLHWDAGAADRYGNLRAQLERVGRTFDNLDLMIAAHAISVSATLVSNDLRHFPRVSSLKLENWV
jgi:tRNA(fMet)-specific endonuclease VapC